MKAELAIRALIAWTSLTALAVVRSPAVEPVATESTMTADLLVVGGTESGCAAALQAARMGVESIVLVNDIDWLGGQFSAEALAAIDENTHVSGVRHEQPIARHGMFHEIITRIEQANLKKYGVARPGNTRVVTTCRPADAARVFEQLLAPHVASGRIRIVRNFAPHEALLDADNVTLRGMRFQSTRDDGKQLTVRARVTIDASDWGDAIKSAGAAYEFGPDLQSKYQEPEAPSSREAYPPADMNPITYCMVIVETDTYEPIPEPAHYDERNYRQHRYPHDPLWLYGTRRIVDHYHFPQIDYPDVLLLCFPAFDYPLDRLPKRVIDALEADERGASRKNIVEMTRRQRQIVFQDARQYSLGFLYYLQTSVHDAMEDKTHSFRRFKLSEEFGTPDRLPPKPYVRESLRLKAMYMMRQQDVLGWGQSSANYAQAMYHDAVAVWQFEFDFHPTRREFLTDEAPAGPWRSAFRPLRNWGAPYTGRAVFPLRSLVPEKVDGLLAAQHNLGFSSIVSSAVRLHDQSVAVGQAAGATAAVALVNGVEPRVIPYNAALLSQVRQGLCSRRGGATPAMLWPFRDLAPDHPAFVAANLLAARGGLPLGPTDVRFGPDDLADIVWRKQVVELSLSTKVALQPPVPPIEGLSKAEFASIWWAAIKDLPDAPFPRQTSSDADGDGIADPDDPLLFAAGPTSWRRYQPPADRDGLPGPLPDDVRTVRLFNFAGQNAPPAEGFEHDHGAPFDSSRGFGWTRDLRDNQRRRALLGEVERDTFLFTRGADRWECTVENGKFHVTVCVGDAGHEQVDQRVAAEGVLLVDDATTAAGQFLERSATIEVIDGRFTLDLGRTGRMRNTCLNWARIARLRSD